MVLIASQLSTVYSQNFIDDYKITETDTLGCFVKEKIKVFVTTKAELNECKEKDLNSLAQIVKLSEILVIKDEYIEGQFEIIAIKDRQIAQRDETIVFLDKSVKREKRRKVISSIAGSVSTVAVGLLYLFK